MILSAAEEAEVLVANQGSHYAWKGVASIVGDDFDSGSSPSSCCERGDSSKLRESHGKVYGNDI